MALLDFFLRSEYYVYGMAAQPALSALKGKLSLATSLDDLIQMFGGTYADIFTKEEEYLQLFKKNMDRMIRAIRQLNPTAEIYYVGMYNTFEYAEPEDDAIRDFLYQAGVDLCKRNAPLETISIMWMLWEHRYGNPIPFTAQATGCGSLYTAIPTMRDTVSWQNRS